jgi:hypothetical protein
MSPDLVAHPGPIPAQAGIGLRFQHHQVVLDSRPDVAWMEVHTENYMGGGAPLRYLDAIRRDCPMSLHGVGLSLGSAEGLDPAHLERIRGVAERIEPGLMSEHIAWSVVDGTYLADLLPLPMTEESLAVVCRHVDQVQSHMKRRIRSQAENSRHAIFSFNPISLFDLKAHFFAPTRTSKCCRAQGPSSLAVALTSPVVRRFQARLDGTEHGSTLVVVGMMRSRGARLSRTNIRAATLYSVGRNDPDHDAVLRIGSESSEAAGPFCTTA